MLFINRLKNRQTGLALTAALFGFLALETTAFAQADAVTNRLNQLENQVQTLSRALYRGAPAVMEGANSSVGGANVDAAGLGVYADRLVQLEQSIQSLTNLVEQQGHQIYQVQERLNRALPDLDSRLTGLEQGNTPAAPLTLAPADSAQTLGAMGAAGTSAAPDKEYEAAFALIREARYEEAEKAFRGFIERYPHHQLTANAQYWLAETYYVRGDFTEAARLFATGYQTYPKAAKAPDSLLKLALSLARLDKQQDACLSLQQLKTEFAGDTGPVMRRALQEEKQMGCAA